MKKEKCVHEGCKRHAETGGYRCVPHSIAYYGGNRALTGLFDHQDRAVPGRRKAGMTNGSYHYED
jgi:hypothetical protein